MKIFLVAGKANSGKNEVAKLIKEFYIYKKEESVITEYSKYIKVMCKELTDWDGNPNTKPRAFLQEIGQKIRGINPTYFVDNMIRDMEIYNIYVQNVIISDVRLPLEIDKIKDNFDEVYSIYVVNQFGASPLSFEEQSDITETALENYPNFDYVIANDDLSKLKDKVFNFLEGIEN